MPPHLRSNKMAEPPEASFEESFYSAANFLARVEAMQQPSVPLAVHGRVCLRVMYAREGEGRRLSKTALGELHDQVTTEVVGYLADLFVQRAWRPPSSPGDVSAEQQHTMLASVNHFLRPLGVDRELTVKSRVWQGTLSANGFGTPCRRRRRRDDAAAPPAVLDLRNEAMLAQFQEDARAYLAATIEQCRFTLSLPP